LRASLRGSSTSREVVGFKKSRRIGGIRFATKNTGVYRSHESMEALV
jgi:hypothetical protein